MHEEADARLAALTPRAVLGTAGPLSVARGMYVLSSNSCMLLIELPLLRDQNCHFRPSRDANVSLNLYPTVRRFAGECECIPWPVLTRQPEGEGHASSCSRRAYAVAVDHLCHSHCVR